MHGDNNWFKYYIPLRWTFATRYINRINIINIISFFIIDAFPSFYIVTMFSEGDMERLAYWILAFITMFCFYEFGYIFNETVCVRFEKNPTIRIPEPYFSKILHHVENLITIRLVAGTVGSCILLKFYPQNTALYITLVLMLLIVYSIHNYWRGRINIITMPLEVTLKYLIPISIFLTSAEMKQGIFIILLVIVFVRTIEYVSKKKFVSWIRVTQNVDIFRIKYYIIINMVMGGGLMWNLYLYPHVVCLLYFCYIE